MVDNVNRNAYGLTMAGCSDVELFFDRELPNEQAEMAFRDHLDRCEQCQDKLHGLMQEAAVVSDNKKKRTKR